MTKKIFLSQEESQVLEQVPPDYYQKGVERNILQRAWHKGKLKAVLGLIRKEPESILDVGSASGWFLSKVKDSFPHAKCVGLDVYDQAIKYGEKTYPEIRFMRSDAHDLPFPSNSFDLVICTEVLEHVMEPGIVLKEIKRVLKKEGAAIVEMDTGNLLFRLSWFWWTNIRKGVWRNAHLHHFTTRKLHKIIIGSGLTVEEKVYFNFTMGIAFLLKKK